MKWPARLVDDLARRRAIPYLGAGVSANSMTPDGQRPPLWPEFLEYARRKIAPRHKTEISLLAEGYFLELCSRLQIKNPDLWKAALQEKFNRPFKSTQIHEKLYDLDSSIYITTNIDKVFDTYANSQSSGVVVIKTFEDNDLSYHIRGNNETRMILKLHGSIDKPDAAVFSRGQYADLMHGRPSLNQNLNALLTCFTFVFFGSGGSDPDIQFFLERLAAIDRRAPPHFFVTADDRVLRIRDIFQTSYNMEVVEYSSADGHAELVTGMEELAKSVLLRREEFAAAALW